MQLASSARIPDGFMAAMRLGGEKPHQGLPGRNPALYQGDCLQLHDRISLRGQAELNRIGSCSTGKERDTETGLDYFGARYYGFDHGPVDVARLADNPEAVPYAELDNPQSLNLYSYVGNNPISRADDDGHEGTCPGNGNDHSASCATSEQQQQSAAPAQRPIIPGTSITVVAAMATVPCSSSKWTIEPKELYANALFRRKIIASIFHKSKIKANMRLANFACSLSVPAILFDLRSEITP